MRTDAMFSLIKAYVRRYVWPLPRFKREVVVMIDGKLCHGGLTDRFGLIMSVYLYCKVHGIPFRLYYVYPCDLKQILLPNRYDWSISADELTYSYYDREEIDLYLLPKPVEIKSVGFWAYNDCMYHERLNRILICGKNKQYHVYGNSFFGRGAFKELWSELFKPSEYLEKRLNAVRKLFDCPYEAVTLRFQQLLGDFTEGDFEVLDSEAREALIATCEGKIDALYKEGYFSTKKVLVTSDSVSFLEVMRKKDYVYTIPGKMEHMDFTTNSDLDMNAKSFVDLYMLSEAKRVTLIKAGKMYKSGFPRFAAELGGVEYNIIEMS